MGLISNIRKIFKQRQGVSEHPRSFPKIIEEEVKAADLGKQPSMSVTPVPEPAPTKQPPKIPEIPPFVSPNLQEGTKKTAMAVPKELPELPGESYFLRLFEQLKAGQLSQEEIANRDLVGQMKAYWQNDEHIIRHKSKSEQSKWLIKKAMSESLTRLSNLEQQWKLAKIQLEQLNGEIEELESEIAAESSNFKQLASKLKFHQHVSHGKYFRLADGRELRSLSELLGALKVIDKGLLAKHITPERNDFAQWVKDVLGEDELSNKMRQCHSKEELISLLEERLTHQP